MGKISEYEQGQLASSVVGVPGVDDSTGNLLTGISTGTDAITGELVKAGQQNYEQQQLDQKAAQKKQDALVQAQQALTNKVSASTQWLDLSGKLDASIEDLKTQYQANPDQAVSEIRKQTTQNIEDAVGNIDNPQVKASVMDTAANSLAGKMSGVESWAVGQRTKNSISDLETQKESLISQAGNAPSFQAFQGIVSEAQQHLQPTASFVLGAKERGTFMADTNEKLASEYLNHIMEQPDGWKQIPATLALPGMSDLLPADKREGFNAKYLQYANMEELKATKQTNATSKVTLNTAKTNFGLSNAQTPFTPQQITGMIENPPPGLTPEDNAQYQSYMKDQQDHAETEQHKAAVSVKQQTVAAAKATYQAGAQARIDMHTYWMDNINKIAKPNLDTLDNINKNIDTINQNYKAGYLHPKEYEKAMNQAHTDTSDVTQYLRSHENWFNSGSVEAGIKARTRLPAATPAAPLAPAQSAAPPPAQPFQTPARQGRTNVVDNVHTLGLPKADVPHVQYHVGATYDDAYSWFKRKNGREPTSSEVQVLKKMATVGGVGRAYSN